MALGAGISSAGLAAAAFTGGLGLLGSLALGPALELAGLALPGLACTAAALAACGFATGLVGSALPTGLALAGNEACALAAGFSFPAGLAATAERAALGMGQTFQSPRLASGRPRGFRSSTDGHTARHPLDMGCTARHATAHLNGPHQGFVLAKPGSAN
jgi:hypothetical protein